MNELNDRNRVDNLKNGLDQVERFDKYKAMIKECSEIDLFLVIDKLGYIMWRIEHDLADRRITYPEWDENDKFVLQAEIELAVGQTSRFGVEPLEDGIKPTEDYFKWYRWWKSYIESMEQEEWEMIAQIIKSGLDYSSYRPEGSWK